MPNKSFSIYNPELTVGEGDQLVIEIAKSHIACVVGKQNGKAIAAYELFTLRENESSDFPEVYTAVGNQSKILDLPFTSCSVYLNHECCLPIPIFKFNKEISLEYLNVVFGEDPTSKVQFEHLPIEPGIMNAFRIDSGHFDFLNSRFSKLTYHHTYSNIIRRVVERSFDYPAEFISIQFYNTFMVVIVLKEGQFHLIQTFTYETPQDVLYYLLNITQQLELFSEKLLIEISGMIDLDFQVYRELIRYFKNVSVQNEAPAAFLVSTNDHPLHYFTPFFNLVL